MYTKLTKKLSNRNYPLHGLISELTALKNDTAYQIEMGVGPSSYQAGLNDAIEIINEHMQMQSPIRQSIRLSHGRVNR